MRTRETQRASQAADLIGKIKKRDDAADVRKEIEALPARIRINGLLQTLIYLLEMGKDDRLMLGESIVRYLTIMNKGETHKKAALRVCNNKLRQATEDAYAFAYWLKLMAKAELPKEASAGAKPDETNATKG